MRWFAFFCVLTCVSLFQSTLVHWINLGTAVPDLYFPLVVYYSFSMDLRRNTMTSWITGLTKDLLSEGSLGINSIFFVAVGLSLWSIRGILFRGHFVTQILVAFIFSMIYNVLYALHIMISFRSLSISKTLWTIFVCSLYTAMVVPILFWFLGKFQPAQSLFSIRDR